MGITEVVKLNTRTLLGDQNKVCSQSNKKMDRFDCFSILKNQNLVSLVAFLITLVGYSMDKNEVHFGPGVKAVP